MSRVATRVRIFDISRCLLSLLIISINIREPFFHSREILFLLLIVTSISCMDFSNIKYTVALIAIWAASFLFNSIVPGSNIVFLQGGYETILISAYLLLMCFCQRRYAKTIIQSYVFVSIVVAFITIVVWIACFASETTFWNLRTFFQNLQENSGLSFMALDYRAILGTRFLTVWYRTSPCMVCALGYLLIRRLEGFSKKSLGNTLVIVLLVAALLMSGTRANILSALLLVALYIVYQLHKKGFKIIVAVIFIAAFSAAIIYGLMFLNDARSSSSAIKRLDTKTYLDIFERDPFRTLIFGWGCGSSFYSLGRQMVVNITELSFFETIRRYGFVATCIILGGIWGAPFRTPLFWEHAPNKFFYLFSLLAYVLVAFTNPYLLDSVGFCALLFYYTWFRYGRETDKEFLEQNIYG